MAMFKREMNGPAARYNARKRELQASMLQYTERVRAINGLQEESFLAEHNLKLDTRSQRQYAPLLDGTERILTPTHHRTNNNINITNTTTTTTTTTNNNNNNRKVRQRPHSLDDKEFLRNKQLNQSLLRAKRRNVKSEYGHPIVIPTDTSPASNISNPQHSSDTGKSSDVRVNFVTTSDFYDLVELGHHHSLPSPRHRVSRVSCGQEGMKLIEQIDLRSRSERKTAWENENNNKKPKDETLDSGNANVLGGFITVKSIKTRSKKINNIKHDSIVNHDAKEKDISQTPKKPTRFKEKLPTINISPATNEIYPLNVLLDTVLSSCKDPLGKMRHRPKRARRMQLHKPNLVMIPEDGGSISNGLDKSSQRHIQDNRFTPRQFIPVPSSASLTAIKEGHKKQHKEAMNFSEKDFEYHNHSDNDRNDKSVASISDGSGKLSQKQKKKRQINTQRLDSIIVNNSILYPTLPWEHDHVDLDTTLLNVDPHDITGKNKKVKRLVFLTDQPENTYRR